MSPSETDCYKPYFYNLHHSVEWIEAVVVGYQRKSHTRNWVLIMLPRQYGTIKQSSLLLFKNNYNNIFAITPRLTQSEVFQHSFEQVFFEDLRTHYGFRKPQT